MHAVFLDSSVLIELKPVSEWTIIPFQSQTVYVGWSTIKELDAQKSRAGFRGQRCREWIDRLLNSVESPIIITTKANCDLHIRTLDTKIQEAHVEMYGLDPKEGDDWQIAEAELYRQSKLGPNEVRVGILTNDKGLLLKLGLIRNFMFLDGIAAPPELLSGDMKRERSRTPEETRVRNAVEELVAAIHDQIENS